MTDGSHVVIGDPRRDARWHRLSQHRMASLFSSPPWIEAICATYGFTPKCRVQVDSGGVPRAGFAWVPINDLCGGRLSSLPFCDHADPIVADQDVWHELVGGVLTTTVPLTIRCFETSVAARDVRLSRVGEAAWHGTPLSASPDELYGRLSKHARRNIRIAERNGVTVDSHRGLGAIRKFHTLHVRLRKEKYGLLAQPLELFERIWQSFAPEKKIVTMLARKGDRVIAGAIFLVWNDVLYYKFGASMPDQLASRPNDAIFWAAIRHGISRNLSLVDWGLSDLDQPGLISYKDKWATDRREIVTLRGGGQHAPTSDEARVLLADLTRLLTDGSVPDEITRRGGELLYRYFC